MKGVWEHCLGEGDKVQTAIAVIFELSKEERDLEVSVYNSILRQKLYKRELDVYEPIGLDDGWGNPRWKQADNLTGGQKTMIPKLPSGSLLSHVPPGNVFDPIPKKDKKPMSRCSRCGCWSSPENVILRKGIYWCKTCCGGKNEIDGESC